MTDINLEIPTETGQYNGAKGKNTIYLSGLSAGVYVLTIENNGRIIKSEKVVKL